MPTLASVLFVTLWCTVLWFFFLLFLKQRELSVRIRWYALLWGALGAALCSFSAVAIVQIFAAKVYRERQVFDFFSAVFAGPPLKEIAKGLFPLFACVALGVRDKRALLVLGAMSGIGFFFTEALGALLAAVKEGSREQWTHELTNRIFYLGHQHAMYTGLTGLGIAFAATRKNWFERVGFVLAGLTCAIGFHASFNAFAQAIDYGEAREGWAYTWSLNRKLILIYVGLLIIAVYRREKA